MRELANYASEVAVGLPAQESDRFMETGLVKQVQAYEAQLIRETLTRYQGDIRRVTAALQIPRKTLYDKMNRHGIVPARHRSADALQN